MKFRYWPVLSLAFGSLIALIAIFGYGAMSRARILHQETEAAHAAYIQAEVVLREIPEDIYLSGLLVRDYLLDPSPSSAPYHRRQLLELRSSLEQRIIALTDQMEGQESSTLLQMRNGVRAYWNSLDPIFEWTPAQKTANASAFLQKEVLPRSQAVMAIVEDISRLNAANLLREQQRLALSERQFQGFLARMLYISLALGILIAFLSLYGFFRLERRANRHREAMKQAERQLRRLSRSLVQVQEDERKRISRELHDEVGQMLTGVGMQLANLNSLRTAFPEEFQRSLEDAARLNRETLRSIRDMAMGLRPSMLDDIGLGPALEWQGREFANRSGVPVTVQIDGTLDYLTEAHRTCIYRVVQEALTNCAKHANASHIRISIYGRRDFVELTIRDDGVGFATNANSQKGLGLVGIEERVSELEGTVNIVTQPSKGTMLKVEIPIRSEAAA